MQGMIQHSLLGGLGWQLPASKLLAVRSTTDAKITEATQQRILTVCDPTAEWVWAGAKVTETIDAAGNNVWEGVWRKRNPDEACGDVRFMQSKMLAVGPILIPANATSFAFQWEGLLPADWRAAINEAITTDCNSPLYVIPTAAVLDVVTGNACIRDQMRSTAMGSIWGRLQRFLGDDMPAKMNKQFVSFEHNDAMGYVMTPEWVGANIDKINDAAGGSFTGTYEEFMRTGLWSADLVDALVAPRPDVPVLIAEHPILKKDYGIFMSVVRRDLAKPWDSSTNPHVLQLVWRPINKNWVSRLWGAIRKVLAKIVEFVKDTFCSLANSQLVTDAAMSSGNTYAMAGSAGAQVLAPLLCQPKTQVCSDGSTIDINATCPPPKEESKKGSPWPWVVGGVAVAGLVAFLLAKPKPKKKQLPAGT
jgi:hypothetical protein